MAEIFGTSPPFGAARDLHTTRLVDLAAALALLGPLCCVAVVLLCLNPIWNPGPLFFQQRRIGKGGQVFTLWKFRTMVGVAEKPGFVTEQADRLRGLGLWLRRWHIDELPQAFNILTGDMAIVGPRPEQVSFAQHYARIIPGYGQRHRVRPGLTGLAQVRQGYTCDDHGARQKLRWDLAYIQRKNSAFDLYLLWETVVLILGRRR